MPDLDESEPTPGTETVPPAEPTAAERLKAPAKPKAAKAPAKPKAAAAPPAADEGDPDDAPPKFRVHVPGDRTLPTLTVEAETAGDAERLYRERTGIITCGHPITVTAAD